MILLQGQLRTTLEDIRDHAFSANVLNFIFIPCVYGRQKATGFELMGRKIRYAFSVPRDSLDGVALYK